MFVTMLAAAALTQAAAPAAPAPVVGAVAGRSLGALPNTTTSYFDLPGKTIPEIRKALDAKLADPAAKQMVQLYGWDVGVAVTKRTEGTKCTVQKATATLTSTVHLPRLAQQAKVDKPVLATWQAYVASLEADAAANLWFLHDRLPAVEQAVVGVDCTVLQASWNAAMTKMKSEQAAFSAQRMAAAQAASAANAAAAAAAQAPAPAKEKRKRD